MLTVRAALQLPVLEAARVVGGERGLDRVVQRAHVVDIPGTDFGDWATGLLLLTAGYGMRHNRSLQAEFVPSLVRQGVAGVIFAPVRVRPADGPRTRLPGSSPTAPAWPSCAEIRPPSAWTTPASRCRPSNARSWM